MSTYRLRSIVAATAQLIFWTALCMCVLSGVCIYSPQLLWSPVLYPAIHSLHLVAILVLRWFYETPLETVQEAARLAGGPWAKRMAKSLNSKQKPFGTFGHGESYSARDYRFYTKAGTIICVALGHWTFWLWLIIPEYGCVTMPLGLAGAIYIWRCRMVLLGPGYQFACDVEAENAAAGYWGKTFPGDALDV